MKELQEELQRLRKETPEGGAVRALRLARLNSEGGDGSRGYWSYACGGKLSGCA